MGTLTAHGVFALAVVSAVVAGFGLLVQQPIGQRLFARELEAALAGFDTLTSGDRTLTQGDRGFRQIEVVMLNHYLEYTDDRLQPSIVRIEVVNLSSGISFGETGTRPIHELDLKVTLDSGHSIEGRIAGLEAVIQEHFGKSKLRRWSTVLIASGIGLGLVLAFINYSNTLINRRPPDSSS